MPRTDRKPTPMFSLNEAAERGIDRVRQPNWANPLDHVKIDLIPGKDGKPTHGLWVHLYSPFNIHCNGRDPVNFLWIGPPTGVIDPDAKGFYAYVGPLPESDEYKADVAKYGSPANGGTVDG